MIKQDMFEPDMMTWVILHRNAGKMLRQKKQNPLAWPKYTLSELEQLKEASYNEAIRCIPLAHYKQVELLKRLHT